MDDSIGREFMEKTHYQYAAPSWQSQGLPQPPLELPAGCDTLIDLPEPASLGVPPVDLRKLSEHRRTLRNYAETPLSLAELSYLLWLTQGVKKVTTRPVTQRTVPSAGARHAFETYLLVNKVEGLAPGLYRFLAIEHKLIPANPAPELAHRLADACQEQPQVENAAVTFFWTAVLERMYWRYGERGYRYLHLDAGHVCQALYLAAESIGCGVCAIAAFDDEQVNALLGLDGVERFTVYIGSLGKRATKG